MTQTLPIKVFTVTLQHMYDIMSFIGYLQRMAAI